MLDLADLWKINYVLFRSEVRCNRNSYHIEATTLICFASLLTRFCMIRVLQKGTSENTIWR